MTTKTISYRKLTGYKYQTAAEANVSVPWLRGVEVTAANGLVRVERATLYISSGYAWDGPSSVTRDDSTNLRSSLFHDAFYQLLRLGALPQSLRPQIDDLFLAQCREDGMSRARLRYYSLIRRFGKLTSGRQNPPKLLSAP